MEQGFYALVLPGGLLGLGAGIVKNRSWLIAVVCGLSAVGLGLFTEWHFFPFVKDESFRYFPIPHHRLEAVHFVDDCRGRIARFLGAIRAQRTPGEKGDGDKREQQIVRLRVFDCRAGSVSDRRLPGEYSGRLRSRLAGGR